MIFIPRRYAGLIARKYGHYFVFLSYCVGVVLVAVTMLDAAEITASAEDGRRCAAAQCFVRGGAGVLVELGWCKTILVFVTFLMSGVLLESGVRTRP